eukprot:15435643-Alexandrium_andersonii.AAC.1
MRTHVSPDCACALAPSPTPAHNEQATSCADVPPRPHPRHRRDPKVKPRTTMCCTELRTASRTVCRVRPPSARCAVSHQVLC